MNRKLSLHIRIRPGQQNPQAIAKNKPKTNTALAEYHVKKSFKLGVLNQLHTSMINTATAQPIEKNKTMPSSREIEILRLIAFEFTSKEIANTLFISRETVNTHRKNLMNKLGVKNVAGLIRSAFEHNLLPIPMTSVA